MVPLTEWLKWKQDEEGERGVEEASGRRKEEEEEEEEGNHPGVDGVNNLLSLSLISPFF